MDSRLILFLLFFIVISCQPSKDDKAKNKLSVVATTGMIEDAIHNIAADSIDIISLMGPGVDPHLYKATQGDLKKLTSADVIFYNGLHLEGKMGEVFEKLARVKPVIAVAENIPKNRLRKVPEFNNNYDPHIWFDVALWKEAVTQISNSLQHHDSINAPFYKVNTAAYLKKLDSLHRAVKISISTIPEDQRVLITAHDAFGYFGDAYDIEVQGLQGISTLSEYGLRDVSDLVKFIVDNKIKAVFVETSISSKAINAVVEGCKERGSQIQIGGYLYSDAMGNKGTPEGTYAGMVSANVETIVNALK